MSYEESYAVFIERHLAARNGERRARLERGHAHAEAMFLRQVWWPLRGDFADLHPEYEVSDWRGRPYFADFAWLSGEVRLLLEIKGYSIHVRDMDRQKYCRELNRETFLHAMGYQVISLAYDDVEQRPDLCINLLRMVLSRYLPAQAPVSRGLIAEKEIIRLAARQASPIRPVDVKQHFELDHKTAVLMLRKVQDKGWVKPVYRGNGQRIVGYELVRGALNFLE